MATKPANASPKKRGSERGDQIYQYISARAPALGDAIRGLCMEGHLSPDATQPGVTFLLPADKSYIDEIAAAADSEDPEEAVRLISALIIPDALQSATDFKRRPVGSHAGVLYEVTGTTGSNSVTIGKDIKLVRDEAFRGPGGRLAVWTVQSGRLPTAGKEYRRPKLARGDEAKAAERKAAAGADVAAARARLARDTEAKFVARLAKGDRGGALGAYAELTAGLLEYLQARHPELFTALLPLVDYNPFITFYLLVEPYKTRGEHLIPDALLFGPDGWNAVPLAADPAKYIAGALGSIGAGGPANYSARDAGGAPVVPFVYRDRGAVTRQVDQLRSGSELNKLTTPRQIRAAYDALAATNQIAGLGPVLPDATRQMLPGAKKLWQDEMRFVLHSALTDVMGALSRNSAADFGRLVDLLRARQPGNDYEKELSIVNVERMKGNVAPTADFYLIVKFLFSTDFLYAAAPPAAVGGPRGDARDPTDREVYNRNFDAAQALATVKGSPAEISPQTLAELQSWVRQHGGLPQAVLSMAK